MLILAIDPGRKAGFALVDESTFDAGEWRRGLPTALVTQCTSDLATAATWRADLVICERQYAGEAGKVALSTLAFGAGALLGLLFETSGADAAYGMSPHTWKDLLCASGGTIRKDVFTARLARALPDDFPGDRTNADQLDAVGLGWALCAALKAGTAEQFEILRRGVDGIKRTAKRKVTKGKAK